MLKYHRTSAAKRNAYRIMVGKPERQTPLGRSKHKRMDNIKIDLRVIEWDGMDWIDLVQDRNQSRALVNTVMILRVQHNWLLLKRAQLHE
jgi:hypothetical protein